jgi:hypothetical protein
MRITALRRPFACLVLALGFVLTSAVPASAGASSSAGWDFQGAALCVWNQVHLGTPTAGWPGGYLISGTTVFNQSCPNNGQSTRPAGWISVKQDLWKVNQYGGLSICNAGPITSNPSPSTYWNQQWAPYRPCGGGTYYGSIRGFTYTNDYAGAQWYGGPRFTGGVFWS